MLNEIRLEIFDVIFHYMTNEELYICLRSCKNFANIIKCDKRLCIKYFIKNNKLLKFALDNGCPKNEYLFRFVVIHGTLENIVFLDYIKCHANAWACLYAARFGKINVLSFLLSKKYPQILKREDIMLSDVMNYDLLLPSYVRACGDEIVKHMTISDTLLEMSIIDHAAYGGNIDCINLLFRYGYKSQDLDSYIICSKNIESIRRLLSSPLMLEIEKKRNRHYSLSLEMVTLMRSVNTDIVDILKVLEEYGYNVEDHIHTLYVHARLGDCPNMLKYVSERL